MKPTEEKILNISYWYESVNSTVLLLWTNLVAYMLYIISIFYHIKNSLLLSQIQKACGPMTIYYYPYYSHHYFLPSQTKLQHVHTFGITIFNLICFEIKLYKIKVD